MGRLEVVDARQDLTPPRLKQRALLALLLLRAGELVSADEAADALWDGEPPPAARNAVQGHVASLRKRLGRDRIETRDGGYVLHLDENELDLHRFERLVTDARGEPPQVQAELLADALDLFRGPALEDFRYDSFAAAEANRIEELRLLATETRLEADLSLGRHEQVVPELERLVRESPLRERLWSQLALALYRSGRQADALSAYRRARETLVEELGIEPGPELQRLERQILNQDPELDLRRPDGPAGLPSPPTPLLGRERELTELRALLLDERHRILTLTGPGGTGKTRLAIEAARQVEPRFPGGTFFVSLAAVADAELVLPAIAHALDVREGGKPLDDALAARLRDRPTLVVLDNAEQLTAAVPRLGRVVAAAAALTLLTTSREPLRLYGERLYRVPPLDEHAAVALFLDRAEAVGWRGPRDEAGDTATEVCRRLDRLPLAIELAAARMGTLSADALLERLSEPLDVLADGPLDQPERQQTLRRTLAWSYERLAAEEQRLFARLAVFAGGWTIDAAAAICSDDGLDVVGGLSSLLDKSLVQPESGAATPRQSMLETIREYAREELLSSGDAAATTARHVAYFLELAEASEQHLRGTPGDWLDRLELEHANLRAALEAAPLETELRLAGALWRFWYLRGHLAEGRRRLERVLQRAEPGRPRAKALLGAAVMAANTGDPDAARARAGEARALAASLGDAWSEAYAAFMLANVTSDGSAARRDYEAAIRAFRSLGDDHSALLASRHLAMLLADTGDEEAARELHWGNLADARATGNGRLEASSLGALAELELQNGDPRRAAALLRESLAVHRELGDVLDTAVDLCRYAAAISADDPERAATLLGAFEGLGDAAAGRRGWVAELNAATHAAVAQRLDDDALLAAVEHGRELPLDDAVALALLR